jgi:hypothetical protein
MYSLVKKMQLILERNLFLNQDEERELEILSNEYDLLRTKRRKILNGGKQND